MSFYYLTSHKEGREVVYFSYITLLSYLSQPFLMLNGGSEVRSHSYLQLQLMFNIKMLFSAHFPR